MKAQRWHEKLIEECTTKQARMPTEEGKVWGQMPYH
jgi:hypothetical protein